MSHLGKKCVGLCLNITNIFIFVTLYNMRGTSIILDDVTTGRLYERCNLRIGVCLGSLSLVRTAWFCRRSTFES